MKLKIKKVESFLVEDGIPDGCKVFSKGRLEDGRFFLIISTWDLCNFQVFIEKGEYLEEVRVDSFFLQDGGSRIVATGEGDFFFPSLVKKGEVSLPTFNGIAVTIL